MKYDVTKGGYILLGRCGENLARTVEIDVSEYLVEYPGAVVTLLHRRHGESGIYPVAVELRDGCLVWQPTSADTAVVGDGEAEVRVTVNGVLAKSKILSTVVDKSLTGQETDVPEPGMDWVDKIVNAIGNAQNMKAEAESVAYGEPATAEYDGKTGTMHFGIPEGRPGRDGTDGKDGAPGVKGDKGDPGEQGPKGDPGSDASVTAENIETALGYAPVRDVQVAGSSVLDGGVANVPIAQTWVNGSIHPGVSAPSVAHGLYISDNLIKIYPAEIDNIVRRVLDRPITPTNLDYAVKAAMCDGKGAAWTSAEQAAARSRMGLDRSYELIEEIVFDEDASKLERTMAPNGTPYSFTAMKVQILNMPTEKTGINALMYMGDSEHPEYIYFYISITNTVASQSNTTYGEAVLRGGYWQAIQKGNSSAGSITPNGSFKVALAITEPSAGFRLTTADVPSIESLRIIPYTGEKLIPAGTTIRIYGVRA